VPGEVVKHVRHRLVYAEFVEVKYSHDLYICRGETMEKNAIKFP
jgi:hypothetical protein